MSSLKKASYLGLFLLAILGLTGCAAIISAELMDPARVYTSAEKEPQSEKRMISNLQIGSKHIYIHEAIDSELGAELIMLVNYYVIPLPPQRVRDFVSFKLNGITHDDLRKLESALGRHGWELYVKRDHLRFSRKGNGRVNAGWQVIHITTMPEEKNHFAVRVDIDSIKSYHWFRLIQRELDIMLSPASAEVRQKARE